MCLRVVDPPKIEDQTTNRKSRSASRHTRRMIMWILFILSFLDMIDRMTAECP